jgi:SlyX protein
MSTDKIKARLDELESRVAFQDELQDQLNDIVARQDREILELKQALADMASRLQDLGDSMPGEETDGAHEVPPHY